MLSITGYNGFNDAILAGDVLANLDSYVADNTGGIFAVFLRWKNMYKVYDSEDDKALFSIDVTDASPQEEYYLTDILTPVLL